MKNYKIFLSGPMLNDNYDNFHLAESYALSLNKLKNNDESNDSRNNQDIQVLNPSKGEGAENYSGQSSTWFRAALSNLVQSDEVWFLPGWRYARGSIVEYTIALSLRLPLYEWSKSDNDEISLSLLNDADDAMSFNQSIVELLNKQDEQYRLLNDLQNYDGSIL